MRARMYHAHIYTYTCIIFFKNKIIQTNFFLKDIFTNK